ncbi:MAG: hypothetical protein RLZZ110_1066, partial [Bacteroidota bacterium]
MYICIMQLGNLMGLIAGGAIGSVLRWAIGLRIPFHAHQFSWSTFFINASRGQLVDESALLQALDQGRVAGAALDVGCAADQMPSPELARHPRVIATPHVGGLTPQAIAHQALETVVQTRDILQGR